MGEARRKAMAVQPRPGETPEQWDARVDGLLAANDATVERVRETRRQAKNPIVSVFNAPVNRMVRRAPVAKPRPTADEQVRADLNRMVQVLRDAPPPPPECIILPDDVIDSAQPDAAERIDHDLTMRGNAVVRVSK